MGKQDLHISLIQSDLHWEKPQANRAMLEEEIWQLAEKTDLIILPEMFSTGFSMNASKLAEPMNLHTFKWMKQMAAQTQAALIGSFIVQESAHYYNRLIFMRPDGEYQYYDKRHLFWMAKEHETYTAGEQRLTVQWKGWNIMPLICYDLRFPVWSRNINLEYDLLIYVANWPSPRKSAWNALLAARAIENLAYCAGVNRVGQDGLGVPYPGESALYDFKGNALAHLNDQVAVHQEALSLEELLAYRKKFPANEDADSFTIHSDA